MKINLSIVGLTFFCVTIFVLCASKKEKISQSDISAPAFLYYQQALRDIKNGSFEDALIQMDIAISMKPEFAEFHFARAQILEILGDDKEAIKSYENALSYKSHFPDAWKNLANLYMKSGQYQNAVQVLRDLTKDQPDSLQYEVLLADAYIHNNKPLMAIDRINYFHNQGGASYETDRIMGLTYFVQANYSESIKYFEKYLVHFPENGQVHKQVGIAHILGGMPDKGISHLNIALKINPNDPEIYLYRAKYFVKKEKYTTAADEFNKALNLDSTRSDVLVEIGKFFLMRSDTTGAEMSFQRCIRNNIDCWECYKYLGIIADEQGRSFEALQYLQKYLTNIYTRDLEAENRLNRLRKREY
jgi:tetratricopeptide (TPR) repeat protein